MWLFLFVSFLRDLVASTPSIFSCVFSLHPSDQTAVVLDCLLQLWSEGLT